MNGPKSARESSYESDTAVIGASSIGIGHYIVVSSILFVLGVLGIFLHR